eukprot:2103237-Rhodomonas_salina.2
MRSLSRDVTWPLQVEFLCQKNEASFFSFASHSKKRPNNLILGRTFDYKVSSLPEPRTDPTRQIKSPRTAPAMIRAAHMLPACLLASSAAC